MPVEVPAKCKDICDPVAIFSVQLLQNQFRYYPLADLEQLLSVLAHRAFKRCTHEDSFLYREAKSNLKKDPKLGFFSNDLKSVFYKIELKQQLLSEKVTFDGYRAGELGNIDTMVLMKSLGICPTSNINIHESDFIDYRLKSLQHYSSYRFEPDNQREYCPEYYSFSDREVFTFKKYIYDRLLVDINESSENYDSYIDRQGDFRLSYDKIFSP